MKNKIKVSKKNKNKFTAFSSDNNFDKNRKLKCFNYNIYGHMKKDCQKPKKK